ncbi:VirB6/TrbL-like conjugal transfer protein, CD1112 family [Anaerocolumna sp.]|uniref:VirB6/TrbL-like conjugal transfer protein, CD1112 family n=1 Tax=Anaerocolumna sp. TaxID=2041569 RepID=UPI0028AC4FB7|nr:CD0415/CD1112 family protein [Anaerocolumna sp.]
MDFILDAINEWITKLLVDGIMGNLTGLFDNINSEVSRIAGDVGKTPSQWNGGVFSMIENLSDTVIMPIAGIILTFVMCYELIQMVIDRNNMHDFPPSDIFKWMMKTFIAVVLVTNTFPIMMGIIMWALSVCIFIIVYGRMLEIYLMTSLGAIPIATMSSKEWNMGNNYLKALLALAFQGFLIMVCVGIYAVLIQSIATGDDPIKAIWTCMMYTVLLCFSLFKTGTLAKSIFSAH